MAITTEKLNLLLSKLKEKFPSPNYLIYKEDGMYKILMDDEELSRSKEFLHYFFKQNADIFGENCYDIVPLYDYFNLIPENLNSYNYKLGSRQSELHDARYRLGDSRKVKVAFSQKTQNKFIKTKSSKYKKQKVYIKSKAGNDFQSKINKGAA